MRTLAITTLIALAAASSARAQEQAASIQGSAPGPEHASSARGMPAAIDDSELAGLNGRQGSTSTILSDQDLTAVNNGNTITATTVGSGPITLGPGAFDGFAGVGNFVINSGHNNNLQGALTINIIAPPQ
jgi:hypothetical protein